MYPDPTGAGAAARLFLALWPHDEVRQAHVDSTREWRWPSGARLTRPERLHVTLHFIGSVAASRLDELKAHLEVPFEPFEFELSQPDVWRAGIAVLCPRGIPREFAVLHERLAAALRSLDLPVEERPYRPHVTLARKAFGAKPPASIAPIRWQASQGYVLVRTLPGGRGYESVAGFA
jgi:2'-5' RNA ligase